MTVTIWHNPNCGTSRKVLAALREAGLTQQVVDARKPGWRAEDLRKLFADAGLTAQQALRTRGTPAEDMGLTAPEMSEQGLIEAMVVHPTLVERPFVATPWGTRLCRPAGTVQDLLALRPR